MTPRSILSLAIAGALFACAAGHAVAEDGDAQRRQDAVDTLDAVQVTASYGYQPVDVKRDSPAIVDSVTYDDIEAPTGDNSIASMLVQVPGVSVESDGDEPRYITVRGISADLNVTTLDGLAIATTGENGSGTRRVNLQLIPSDISERVDVFKAFTAEQDSAGIGGAIDIVTRSAFNTPSPYFMVDGYGIYSDFAGPEGENSGGATKSHWGKGLKTAFSRRFGADEQFGLVFTARYQDRVRNSSKIWHDQRSFFDDEGRAIAAPDPELGWDGRNALPRFSYGDYSNVITNKGASAKFEWRPRPEVTSFLMGYLYNRRESSTMNASDVQGDANAITDRTEDTGTVRVNYIDSRVRYNQWDRTASGLTSGVDWDLGALSTLSLRAGYTREVYKDLETWTRVRSLPGEEMSFTYLMRDLPQMTSFTGDPFARRYVLNGASMTDNYAQQNVLDTRVDYAWNLAPGATGFGLRAGAKWTRLRVGRHVDSLRPYTGGDVTGYMYDPEYSPHGSNGLRIPWLDYDRFWSQGVPPIDEQASAEYNAVNRYYYEETVANGYLSLHYATDATRYILGLRHDRASFDGWSPRTVNGEVSDELSRPSGDYAHWLPSFNVVHDLDESWKLRGSVSRTIGRPTPAQIVQAETENCGEDFAGCSISRGNPELRPRRAKNLDLALEHYFPGGEALVALTAFRKEIADDIFTLTTEWVNDGVEYRSRQPMNAEESTIQGLELALVNRAFGFHPNLGASFNVSRLSGEMRYVTDTVERRIDRMLSQPDWMANLTLTYRIPRIDGMVRLSANYQDDYLSGIGATPWNDKFAAGRTTVDLSMWHRMGERWTLKYEVDNLFDSSPEWFHGRDVGGTISQRDDYGQGVYVHAIYAL